MCRVTWNTDFINQVFLFWDNALHVVGSVASNSVNRALKWYTVARIVWIKSKERGCFTSPQFLFCVKRVKNKFSSLQQENPRPSTSIFYTVNKIILLQTQTSAPSTKFLVCSLYATEVARTHITTTPHRNGHKNNRHTELTYCCWRK